MLLLSTERCWWLQVLRCKHVLLYSSCAGLGLSLTFACDITLCVKQPRKSGGVCIKLCMCSRASS